MLQLLTAGDPVAGPAVCLLSTVELRLTRTSILVALRNRCAAAHLTVTPSATIVVWDEHFHYMSLALHDRIVREPVTGYVFAPGEVGIDRIGAPTRPPQYQMQAELAVTEHWGLTRAVLAGLSACRSRRCRLLIAWVSNPDGHPIQLLQELQGG